MIAILESVNANAITRAPSHYSLANGPTVHVGLVKPKPCVREIDQQSSTPPTTIMVAINNRCPRIRVRIRVSFVKRADSNILLITAGCKSS
jgi:hypothetical protein